MVHMVDTIAVTKLETLGLEIRHIWKRIEVLLYNSTSNLYCRENGVIEYVWPVGSKPKEVYDLKTLEGIEALQALCLRMLKVLLPQNVWNSYITGKKKRLDTIEVDKIEPWVSLLWLTYLLSYEINKVVASIAVMAHTIGI